MKELKIYLKERDKEQRDGWKRQKQCDKWFKPHNMGNNFYEYYWAHEWLRKQNVWVDLNKPEYSWCFLEEIHKKVNIKEHYIFSLEFSNNYGDYLYLDPVNKVYYNIDSTN